MHVDPMSLYIPHIELPRVCVWLILFGTVTNTVHPVVRAKEIRGSVYRLLGFFEWACHIKNVDILGGTPTWDLDVPVHGTVANHAGWPSELFT